jgi:hypothetical protein
MKQKSFLILMLLAATVVIAIEVSHPGNLRQVIAKIAVALVSQDANSGVL